MTRSVTVFRLLAERDKPSALKRAVSGNHSGSTFYVAIDGFALIPGAPFAYSLSERARDAFRKHPKWMAAGRSAHQGLATADNFRFVRAWWEADRSATHWRSFAKGATRVPFYGELSLLMNWRDDGAEMKAWAGSLYNNSHWSRIMMNAPLYFTSGITYSRRPHERGWFQILPPGAIFSTDSPLIIGGAPARQLVDCALLNSTCFSRLLGVLMARGTEGGQTLKYETGYVSSVPLPLPGKTGDRELEAIARRGFGLACELESDSECSHYFTLPRALRRQRGLPCRAKRDLQLVLTELDQKADALFGLASEDFGEQSQMPGANGRVADDVDDDGRGGDAAQSDEQGALCSWIVGAALGRFDPRLATGERAMPPGPEPFDPLPSRSPGMYPEGDEPPDRPDILVDDKGHADDLATRARVVGGRVQVDVPENLRGWLAKEFFPLHIKMYSKSRRKAPIYWQLATPSASYSVWLYIHAFSKDTLFRVQNDYATPKLAHEERRLESVTRELRNGATAAQRKFLAVQEGVVEELRVFLEEVKRIAPLWKPNLDDGVVINFAPLWRLVPQNKSWQKELKSTWDALCEAKYDWAHLAMHLWPERVVPKCAKDRSIAIAHGLEDVFWVEGTDGKWTARNTPTRSIDELVRERTSPAVKSALKSLLEAPLAIGNAGRELGRRRKAAKVAEGREA